MFPGPLTSDCVEEVQPPVWGPACRLAKTQKTSLLRAAHSCTNTAKLYVKPWVRSIRLCASSNQKVTAAVEHREHGLGLCVKAMVNACKASPLPRSPALLPLHGGKLFPVFITAWIWSFAERVKHAFFALELWMLFCIYHSDLPAITMHNLFMYETLHIWVVCC